MVAALILDDHARAAVMTVLAGVPGLLADLDITLTRAHRFASGAPAGRGRERDRLPVHLGASAAIDDLAVVLRVFTAKIAKGRAAPGEPVEQARWLYRELPRIPGDHPALEGFEQALLAAAGCGFAVIDRPEDHLYMGLCECGLPLWVAAGARGVRCVCGMEMEVAARRRQMLEQARYRFGTAGELARLLPWFADMPITAAAITKAGERGKLPRITVDGRVWYRIGDVMDWHIARYGTPDG